MRRFAYQTSGHKAPSPQTHPQAYYRSLCRFFQLLSHHGSTAKLTCIRTVHNKTIFNSSSWKLWVKTLTCLRRIATSACESSMDWLPHSVQRTLWLMFLARASSIWAFFRSSSLFSIALDKFHGIQYRKFSLTHFVEHVVDTTYQNHIMLGTKSEWWRKRERFENPP